MPTKVQHNCCTLYEQMNASNAIAYEKTQKEANKNVKWAAVWQPLVILTAWRCGLNILCIYECKLNRNYIQYIFRYLGIFIYFFSQRSFLLSLTIIDGFSFIQ